MGTWDDMVIVMESNIMEGTHKYPKLMDLVNIEIVQASVDNVD